MNPKLIKIEEDVSLGAFVDFSKMKTFSEDGAEHCTLTRKSATDWTWKIRGIAIVGTMREHTQELIERYYQKYLASLIVE